VTITITMHRGLNYGAIIQLIQCMGLSNSLANTKKHCINIYGKVFQTFTCNMCHCTTCMQVQCKVIGNIELCIRLTPQIRQLTTK